MVYRHTRHQVPEVTVQEEDSVIVCATLERSQVVAAAVVNMASPWVRSRKASQLDYAGFAIRSVQTVFRGG